MEATTVEANPGAANFDAGRARSMGPLTRKQISYCRSAGVPLSYDPTAYGWVSSLCEDDVPPFSFVSAIRRDAIRGDVDLENRFDRACEHLLRSWEAAPTTIEDIRNALYELSETSASDVPPNTGTRSWADQIRVHCRLQQKASRLLAENLELRAFGEGAFEEVARRYTFQHWTQADVDRYVELLDDPEIWLHLDESYPDPLTAEYAVRLIDLSRNLSSHEVRAVVHNGEVVGQVRLQFENAKTSPGLSEKDAEISYWLGRPYWGRGLMSDIVRLYTWMSFKSHGLESLSAWVRESNRGSVRVLEKSGYHYLGRKMSERMCGPSNRVYRAFRSDFLNL